jgi:hypothetical protein
MQSSTNGDSHKISRRHNVGNSIQYFDQRCTIEFFHQFWLLSKFLSFLRMKSFRNSSLLDNSQKSQKKLEFRKIQGPWPTDTAPREFRVIWIETLVVRHQLIARNYTIKSSGIWIGRASNPFRFAAHVRCLSMIFRELGENSKNERPKRVAQRLSRTSRKLSGFV